MAAGSIATGRSRLWRYAGIVALGLVPLWVSVAFTRSVVLSKAMPESAAASWRTVPALTESATARFVDATGQAQIGEVRRLSVEALRREPMSVEAVRTLALTRDGGATAPQAAALMAFSEQLSRRDTPTQFWYIEHAVAEGDIAGALAHYDRALSTSFTARPILLPVLAKAADDPAIARQLATRLARRPNWWEAAAPILVGTIENPATLGLILRSLRLDPRNANDRSLLAPGMIRIVDRGGLDAAIDLYRSIRGTAPSTNGLTDGFGGDLALPPFDWTLAADADLSANQVAGDRVEITVADSADRPAATRLLTLRPGRYRLTSRVGGVDDAGTVRITLHCLEANDATARKRLLSPDGDASSFDFSVPEGCRAQWLALTPRLVSGTESGTVWAEGLRITASR